ncbi:flagellar hook-length control protein FliK [Pleionea litopenaei]|uniref:Flagellar hook-length control protein FliK n=1 Tax=Pleionea litopenaei TaxID=3070815 RepID=A0AA51RUD6_9GAMM|nr:flagellar hook-length control protein FliK [Pleionea sp. HL-JVS1]WMS87679.1 flagellar hook-length control protein FliK [Pleionea sp. HL-JVS1]
MANIISQIFDTNRSNQSASESSLSTRGSSVGDANSLKFREYLTSNQKSVAIEYSATVAADGEFEGSSGNDFINKVIFENGKSLPLEQLERLLDNDSGKGKAFAEQIALEQESVSELQVGSSTLQSGDAASELLTEIDDAELLNGINLTSKGEVSVSSDGLSGQINLPIHTKEFTHLKDSAQSKEIIQNKEAIQNKGALAESLTPSGLFPLNSKLKDVSIQNIDGYKAGASQIGQAFFNQLEVKTQPGEKTSLVGLREMLEKASSDSGKLSNNPRQLVDGISLDKQTINEAMRKKEVFEQIIRSATESSIKSTQATDEATKPSNFTDPLNSFMAAKDPSASATKTVAPLAAPIVLHQKGWQGNFSQMVNWMSAKGIEQAEIQLDPKELGPLTLRVSHNQGDVQVVVQAQHAQTRDLFEMNQDRLREMLLQQGINLSQFDVKQNNSQHREGDSNSESFTEQPSGSVDEISEQRSMSTIKPQGLLDLFA